MGDNIVLPDEEVITKPRNKKICDVVKGDRVLTHNGGYKTVKKTYERDYGGKLFEIKPQKFNIDFKVTQEHFIRVAKPNISFSEDYPHGNTQWSRNEDGQLLYNKIYGKELDSELDRTKKACGNRLRRLHKYKNIEFDYTWKEVKDISSDDLIVYPIVNETKKTDFRFHECIYCGSDNLIKRGKYNGEQRYECGNCGKTFLERYFGVNKLYDYTDDDLLYLLGLFFADGNANPQGGKVRFSIQDEKLVKDVENKLEKVFGIEPKTHFRARSENDCYVVTIHSTKLARRMNLYGKRSEKSPPIEILHLPVEKQRKFLEGYMDGDGYRVDSKTQVTTCSSNHLFFITQILLRIGIIPSITQTESIDNRYMITYTNDFNLKGIIDNENLLLPIDYIKKKSYSGKVHNLRVKNNNSYTLLSLIVTSEN